MALIQIYWFQASLIQPTFMSFPYLYCITHWSVVLVSRKY